MLFLMTDIVEDAICMQRLVLVDMHKGQSVLVEAPAYAPDYYLIMFIINLLQCSI